MARGVGLDDVLHVVRFQSLLEASPGGHVLQLRGDMVGKCMCLCVHILVRTRGRAGYREAPSGYEFALQFVGLLWGEGNGRRTDGRKGVICMPRASRV